MDNIRFSEWIRGLMGERMYTTSIFLGDILTKYYSMSVNYSNAGETSASLCKYGRTEYTEHHHIYNHKVSRVKHYNS